jgi:hypothetical protein
VKGGWLVGALAVVVLAYITLNTLRTEGLSGLEPGSPLPPFAVPAAASASDADARVSADACSVRGAGVITSCGLTERGPAVLAFVVSRAGECEDQLDTLDRVAPRFPGVAFAGVVVEGDPGDVRELARERGWEIPVGYDHDGAVGILYGLGGVCPLVTFAGRDGRVAGSVHGVLDEAALSERVRSLDAGQRLP